MKRALCVLLSLAACRSNLREAPPPADKIIFSHDFHQKLEFDCSTCHEEPNRARPTEATCLTCHKDQKEAKNCGMCHTNADRPGTYAPRLKDITMPHALHAKAECATCH